MEFFDIAALVTSIVAGAFSLFTFIANNIHDKKADTLNAFNVLQEQCFDKLNLYSPSQIKEICKDKKSEEYKTISGYIARLEHFCVGVNNRIYNRKTVYDLAHGYLDGPVIKQRIMPIIETKNTGEEDYFFNIKKVLNYMDKKSK